MDYNQAVDWLGPKVIFGINPGLGRVKALANYLREPHQDYSVIQVTGTNGKTSVVRMLTSILTELGLCVGSYTSPHLQTYTERITLGRQLIKESDFAQALSEIIPFVERVDKEHEEPLTHFEILTGLAFHYFSRKQVDCAVLEVGMGGRWDATSITCPQVSVITNVELEHTDRLGDTVEQIAKEKAHVIKKNTKAVVGEVPNNVLEIITRRCREQKATLKIMGHDFSFVCLEVDEDGCGKIGANGLFGDYNNLKPPLLGKFQTKNTVVAIAAAECFCSKPLELSCLKRGLYETKCPGRLEIIQEAPKVVLDGAHNPSGFSSLLEGLNQEFSYQNLILVLGILEDKDVDSMLRKLVPKAAKVISTQSHSERAISAEVLGEKVRSYQANPVVESRLTKAIELALEQASSRDLVLITGSLYTVGEARDYFKSTLGE